MTALTTRDTLKRELQRHIGAHADIVANALIASGAVIDAATLADDEALYDRVENEVMATLVGYGHVDGCWVDVTYAALRALPAALTERGAQ